MGRSIGIADGNLVVRHDGIERLATLVGELVIPRDLIEWVQIGLPDAPSVWTAKRVGTAAHSETRAGAASGGTANATFSTSGIPSRRSSSAFVPEPPSTWWR